MIQNFLIVLLFFAPAFAANAAPVLVKHIPGLRRFSAPISEKFLGKNKTWRGLIAGILVAEGVAIGIALYFPYLLPVTKNPLLVGGLMGFGALAGDAAESALKRAIKISPGAPLPFLDGVDYIGGAILFVAPIFVPDVTSLIFLLLFAPLASLIANSVSYFCGWKNVWW